MNASKVQSAQSLFDDLFSRLNSERPAILSYKSAYERLFGPAPTPWSQGYAVKVLNVAKAVRRRAHPELGHVGLDTFIVAADKKKPNDGHWPDAEYTKEDWERVFANAEFN